MSESASIWIVVLTYNGLEDTRKCLTSLADAIRPGTTALLVDNGSTDGTADVVKDSFPWCQVLRLSPNIGPAGGNNAGIEKALAEGAHWIVLLNNDTTVAAGLIEQLVRAAVAHPEYAILGPVLYFMSEPDVVMTDGCTFNAPGYHGFFQRKPVPLGWSNPPAVTTVDVVNGCCMMIRADVFRSIGLFDRQMFIYHDETDFCLRAAEAGLPAGVIDHALIWHKGSSTMKMSGKKTARYYDARNLLHVLRKHRGARSHGRGIVDTLTMYVKYVYYRYCVEHEEGFPVAAEGVLEGVADGITGHLGPYAERRRILVPAVRRAFELLRLRPKRAAAADSITP